jgi:ABC-2 type transport system permease protein
VVGGAVLGFSITLIVACSAFRFTSVGSLLMPLGYFAEFTRFPLGIYGRPIQFALTWLLPFAMAGLFPAGFLLGKDGYRLYGMLAPLMGWLFLGLALLVWRVSVRGYKSTGT